MKKLVKKRVALQFPFYHETEKRLEQYAEEGLILENVGGALWTFRQEQPRNLKYAITTFEEGSEFNPRPTDNQEIYFDYAKESGWDFVCAYNQLHIFSSEQENPVPFETEEAELLENLHACIWKSVIVPNIIQIAVYSFALLMASSLFVQQPQQFMDNLFAIAMVTMLVLAVLSPVYVVVHHYRLYGKAKKALELGLTLESIPVPKRQYGDKIILLGMIIAVGVLYFELWKYTRASIAVFTLLQVPVVLLVTYCLKQILKKIKLPAKYNKIITFIFMIILTVVYCGILSYSSILHR